MRAFLQKAFSIAKKVFIVIAVYFVVVNLFFYFFSKDKPQTTYDPIKENRVEIYKNIKDPRYETKEGKIIVSAYRISTCLLIGEACTDNPSDGDKNFGGSLFGGVAKLIAAPIGSPPASGTYWAFSSLERSGFIPKAYAAEGIGFSGLKAFMDLWRLFRDAALLLLVVVLIAIGFLIMFRVKINPQTIITLENSLPRIVITLLLIVFPFAIAGFLIDLMYLATILAISVLSKNTVYHIDTQGFYSDLFGGGTGTLFNQILWNQNILEVGPALFSVMPAIVNTTVRVILTAVVTVLLYKVSPGKLPAIINNLIHSGIPVATTLIGALVSILIFTLISSLLPLILSVLILAFTGLFVFFRIFFLIFKAYIKILLYIIFAPFLLLFEAVPGRKAFSGWIKTLFAELLVIPLVVTLMLLSTIIVNMDPALTTSAVWQPPFIYSANPKAFNILIGVGILFLIPDIAKAIKEKLGIKAALPGAGFGVFFTGITGAGGGAFGGIQKIGSIGYTRQYLKQVPFIGDHLPEWLKGKG